MLTTTTTAFFLSSLLLAQGAPLPLPQDPSASSSSSSSSSNDNSLIVTDQFQPPSAPSDYGDWAAPSNMTDLSTFSVEAYIAGQSNLQILSGSPDNTNGTGDFSVASTDDEWDASINSVRVIYPKGSINPGQTSAPVGGAEFYAHPMDVTRAQNVTLEYEVYFPADFDFAKGGKLPGLYGGKDGCSGGDSAEDCFSTRLMWRQGGLGELYLYAPKTKQTPRLCKTPPLSVCNVEEGLSIGRGAWTFARGGWTTIRQDVWLNSAGRNDGGFNIWINGRLALTGSDVYYRNEPGSIAPVIPSRRPKSVWKRFTDKFTSRLGLGLGLGLGLKPRFDNGQWKGINGYPGDPGYNGNPNPNAVSATDDVYTFEFTEVVTWPHALPTVTVTVTADPEPTDPPADDPPADDAPSKRQVQVNQDDTNDSSSQTLDSTNADAQAADSSLGGSQSSGTTANTDSNDSLQPTDDNANIQAQTQPDSTDVDVPAQSTGSDSDVDANTSQADASNSDEDIGAQAAKAPAKPAVKAPPPKAPAKPPVPPKPPVPAPKPPLPAPAPPAKVVTVTAPAPPAKTVTLPAPPPIVVTAPAPPGKTVTAPAPPPIIVTAVPAPIIVTAPAPPPVIYTVPAQIVTVTVKSPAAAITPPPVVIVTPQQGKLRGSFRHHQQAVLQPIPASASVYGHKIGFKGLHFSTFFGGHSQDWASPKDQHSFFRRFKMRINQ